MCRYALVPAVLAAALLAAAPAALGPALAQSNTSDDGTAGEGGFDVSCDELRCTFDARSATLTNGTIASYAWSFGDDATGEGPVVNHTYRTSGTYNATLTLTDEDGQTHNRTQQVTAEAVRTAGQGEVPWLGLLIGALVFAGSIAIARWT